MTRFCTGLALGLLLAPATAQLTNSWGREDVVPICLVVPRGDDFLSSCGGPSAKWSRSQVVPVCMAKPFVGDLWWPAEGASAVRWHKSEIKPMTRVYPTRNGGFTQ